MSKNTAIENSRTHWRYTNHSDGDMAEVKVGCLQRIADATELMAKNYANLIQELDRYKRKYEFEREHGVWMERRNAALRGVITKLKKARNP